MANGAFELRINATFEANMSTQTVVSGVTISTLRTFEEAVVRRRTTHSVYRVHVLLILLFVHTWIS